MKNADPSTETLRVAAINFTELAQTLGQTHAARALAQEAHYQKALQKLQQNDIPAAVQQLHLAARYMDTEKDAA